MKANSRGFTLIELIVVILILGILAAVVVPKYIDITTQAKKISDEAYVDSLRGVTMLLFASNTLAGTNIVKGTVTNAWPTLAQVTNSMTFDTTGVYRLQFYTQTNYNYTNGTWTYQ